MDPLIRDLRHAFTRLIRDRGFAVVTMVTLALGIGANTAVFSLVKAALLSPLPYGDAERLTVIWGPDTAETTHLSLQEVFNYPRETRSEERRVGKECRARRGACAVQKRRRSETSTKAA